jgi:hypothetical protein
MLNRLKSEPNAISLKSFNESNIGLGWRILYLISGFPLFLLGLLLLIIPYHITRFAALKLVSRIDFMGSASLALGLLIFGVFGILETVLVAKVTENYLVAIVFSLLLPFLGKFTWNYFLKLRDTFLNKSWMLTSKKGKRLKTMIDMETQQLAEQLKQAYRMFQSR